MKTVGYAIVGTGYFGAELGRIMKTKEGAKIVASMIPKRRCHRRRTWLRQ